MNVTPRQSAGRDRETMTSYSNVQLVGTLYPAVYLRTGDALIQPILETTQSTGVSTTDVTCVHVPDVSIETVVTKPVFFFLYNTDNYFHFLYDAVPTLAQWLRMPTPRPKLLMNPRQWYPYILDTLQLLGVAQSDIEIANPSAQYQTVWVASSPTHEGHSNEPPHPSIWDVYAQMRAAAGNSRTPFPTKIYVSRRSWIHGDTSNMGSNYTTRRKLLCEDELVKALEEKGYTEVFCETLSMAEKIRMFSGATHVVGAIGGGMCNLVFSPPTTQVVCIASPEFERINHRFLFTMQHTRLCMFRDTWTTSNLYRRAKVGGVLGEVIGDDDGMLTLALGNGVTWSTDSRAPTLQVPSSMAVFLDQGLNSPWNFNVKDCMLLIQ